MLLVVVQATLNCRTIEGIDLRAVLRLPIVVTAINNVFGVKAQVALKPLMTPPLELNTFS